MAKLERTYNVPLRKEFMKVPRYKKTNKAVKALREYIMKHMKSEDVSLSKNVNDHLWAKGIKNPPHHIKVNAVKGDDGKVSVERAKLEGMTDFLVVPESHPFIMDSPYVQDETVHFLKNGVFAHQKAPLPPVSGADWFSYQSE